jgi:hypothetical protein
MQTLGTSDLEELLTGELLSSLRKSFRSTLRQALVERHFCERLADLGFARHTATHKEEGHGIEYRLKRLGKIVAIDPAPLKRISQLLKLTPFPHERNASSIFVYRPDESAAWVTIQPNGNVTKHTQLALLTKEQRPNKQVSRLIRQAFIIQRHSYDRPPWQHLRELISNSIEKYESTTITTVADALTETFEDYLEAQAAVAGQGKLFLEDFVGHIVYGFKPPHVSELRLSDLASYAARNRSHDCLDEVLNSIYKLAETAFEKQNEKYFRDWIFQFYWAYDSFGPYAKGPELSIAPDITRRIHWLSDMLSTHLSGHEKSIKRVEEFLPYALGYLSLCLHMIKISGERCDQCTFDAVIEHLGKFLKYKLRSTKRILDSYQGSAIFSGVPPELQLCDNTVQEELLREYERIYDYKNLVYVVAGAWLMHKVKANELEAAKVTPFIKKLIDSAGDFRSLLDLYAMPGMADMTTSCDNPLGFDGWDRPRSPYPQARYGTDFQSWIRPFYQFLLLKKARVSRIGLDKVRQTEVSDHDSLKEFLEQIVSPDFSLPDEYQGVPWTLNCDELQKAKTRIDKSLKYWSAQSDGASSDQPDSRDASQ